MTDEELVAHARELAAGFRDLEGRCPGVEEMPKVRVVDAIVVYFKSDRHDTTVEVVLERKSGKFLGGTLTPHKPKPPS
jgi:hypothetical protein